MKRERRGLMASLAALKGDQGKGGSELQAEDVARLRHETEAKKDVLNQLRQVLLPQPKTWLLSLATLASCCPHLLAHCSSSCGSQG